MPDDTFADPRFMARYALNMIDPTNWSSVEGGYAYISPPEEDQHIAELQTKRAAHTTEFGIDVVRIASVDLTTSVAVHARVYMTPGYTWS